MTVTMSPTAPTGSGAQAMLGEIPEVPMRRRRTQPGAAWELLGCLGAAVAFVALVFYIANERAPFGFVICSLLTFLALYGVLTRLLHGILVTKDRLAAAVVWVGASIALFPLAQIIVNVTVKGFSVVFSHFPGFLFHTVQGASQPAWQSGMGNAIVGTVEQVGLATLYTVPISLVTATYLSESNTNLSRIVRTIVDCMMGTPSIIAGIFVYLFWVQPRGTAGYSGFAASLALAVLMLPVMIRTAEEVIRVMPGSLREAALALGSPRWRVSLRVVLPTVRSGLITAVILGVALAVGETAPTLFTAHGNFQHYNFNPFHGVQANLPLQVFEMIELSENVYRQVAWGGAFILVWMVLGLFVLARIVGSSKPGKRRLRLFRRTSKEVVVP